MSIAEDRRTRSARTTLSAEEPPRDQDAFLLWAQGRVGRWELSDAGGASHRVGASKKHALVTMRICRILMRQLGNERWFVYSADLAVRTTRGVRYPDLIVEAAGGDLDGLACLAPVVVGEVLSPSSVATDLIVKAREYAAIASLRVYLVASQDGPILWVWTRGEDGDYPDAPLEVAGREAEVVIPALGASLPLGEVYDGFPDLPASPRPETQFSGA